jgi:CreA protein
MKILTALIAGIFVTLPVQAEMLHKVKTSGMMIKDSLEIHAMDDPDIKGVTCYYTLPKRTLSVEDQTDSSISCRQVGPISGELSTKESIMKSSKSWFIKELYIDRIYDKGRNVLIYVSYTKKLTGDNANNSISVVPIYTGK